MNIGIGNGWTAPILQTFTNSNTTTNSSIEVKSSTEISFTLTENSWIASLDNIGRIAGAIISAIFVDIVGRKPILVACAFLFTMTWLVIFLSKSVLVVCAMRILFGIAKGMNDGANSVYLGENTSPVIRGIVGTIASASYYAALLGEYIVATYLSYTTTSLVNMAFGLLTCVTAYWIVEPVHYLLMSGNFDKAAKNFMWLKGAKSMTNLDDEFDELKRNVQSEKSKRRSVRDVLTSRANRKGFVIVFVIYLLVGAMGFSPIVAYNSMAFKRNEVLTENQFTILFGASQFFVAISTSCVIGSFNRRSIITVCSALIVITHVCTAALYYVNENLSQIPYFPWLSFSSITLFAAIYSFMYPAIFLIRSELFPLSIKAFGGCISLIGNSSMSFLTTKTFVFVSERFGIHVNFLIFAVVSLQIVLFAYFLLPETRNKTLIEIQHELEGKKSTSNGNVSYVEVPLEENVRN